MSKWLEKDSFLTHFCPTTSIAEELTASFPSWRGYNLANWDPKPCMAKTWLSNISEKGRMVNIGSTLGYCPDDSQTAHWVARTYVIQPSTNASHNVAMIHIYISKYLYQICMKYICVCACVYLFICTVKEW